MSLSRDDQFAKLRIPLDDIVSATNNFDDENLIKEDGIVKIYKGKLSLQSDILIDVVVRRLVGMDGLKRSEFMKKIQLLSSIKHKNLISIIGFCDENDECIIVIEDAFHGSLDQHLHSPTLNWSQRLKICLGAARAFDRLHLKDATHGDIRCSRVLLNNDWEAKVSCFGLSPENHLLLTFQSTDGDQLYFIEDGTNKSDVCSFGVILFEVLCGRKSNFGEVVGDEALAAKAKSHYVQKTLEEAINPNLREQIHPHSLTIFLETAYRCLADQREVRRAPYMRSTIVEGLENTACRAPYMSTIVEGLENAVRQTPYTRSTIVEGLENALEVQLTHENIKTLEEAINPNLREQMHPHSLTILPVTAYRRLADQRKVRQAPYKSTIVEGLENALEVQLTHEYIEKNLVHLKIPFSALVSATNNFSEIYLVQSDGNEQLYKAELSHFDRKSSSTAEGSHKGELPKINITVAIKSISYDKNEGAKGLFADLKTLTSCKHKNIVSLLGFSWEGSQMIFVYEYPLKGSLHDYLGGTNKTISLTWEQRIRISLDIARGIDYLLNSMANTSGIIRGVKSVNILLGDGWNAKIASFKISNYNIFEYRGMDLLANKSEIYSFGVLLFEILSGRLDNTDLTYEKKGLVSIAERLLSNGTLKELVDPKILEEVHRVGYTRKIRPNQYSLKAFSRIAYRCVKKVKANEQLPTMSFVIEELEKALHFQIWGNFEHLKIALEDVVLATENFAKTCIGSGGYGIVYKAELNIFCPKSSLPQERKNSTVAIKRILNREDEQGDEGFLAELEVLSRCEHPNIVSLLGFCVEGPEKILIYEYAENGSLDSYLGCTEPKIYLTWSQRIKLCLDIAYGLNYLHTTMTVKNRIIHRDIKSGNILLDKNWQAKIADFGLSKFHPTNQLSSTINTNNMAGTEVYMDPEYMTTGKLKKESDIYSLGVVLFEVLFGRLAYDSIYMEQNKNGLAPIARFHFDKGTLKEMIDPKIKEEDHELTFTRKVGPNPHSLDAFSNIAYQCVAETQAKRPTMISVIKELKKALHFQEYRNDILKISLEDIKLATDNFSDNNSIKTGGYGKVYNGNVQYDTGLRPVLVKRLHKSSQEHNFLTELEIIFMHKHENVIGLVGYCQEMDEKIIVYEHMSNGSLDRHLNKVSLGWIERLKICIDVASGLDFLHECIQKEDMVIHRDIKSSSILLNGDWKAKISDFEQSLITPTDKKIEYVINDVVGTPGYCEYPLYWDMNFLTKESDIYSLGVVLFEIFCGRLTMENFNATGQYLDSFVNDCFEQGKLDEIVFKDIKEHIAPQSLTTFQMIAYQCLHHKRQKRPTIGEVVVQLKKALQYQEDHEIWELKLPIDYKDIFQLSKYFDIYSTKSKKDLYDMLSKGILLQDGKVWFSYGSNGERTELVSARTFSYINHCLRRWPSIKESRFEKVVEMLDIKNLKIKIKTKAQFLSPGVVYGVYLVFKFCDSRKISSKPTYVNLQYRKGGKSETLHAYFSTWRDEEWMIIELFRFLNHKEHSVFEFLLQSISSPYCRHDTIYVEGIEFRVIDNAKHEETEKLKEVSHPLKLNSNASKFQRSENNDEVFWLSEVNGKKHLMLSAKKALYNLYNEKLFTSKSSAESSLLYEPIFEEVIELRPQQVFRINCKFESQKLSPDTDYSCYLVFRLSDKCCGLYCPVKVRNLLHRRNKEGEIIYFRSPSPWNLHDNNHVPKQREDGWMEVKVWKLNSNHELKKDHINVNLKLISYEGTMAGLIACGLEFRPV